MLTYTSLTVTLDDGTQVTASNHDSQWADWSAAVTFKEAGQHTATAAATSTSGRTVSGELRVQVQAAGPTITLQSAVTSPTLDYDLVVSAKPTLGVSATVHYSLDNATFYPMTEVLSLWFTKLPGLFSNPIPAAGGPPVTIWLRGADASGTVTLPVQISPVDTTPPAVLSLAPADGARAEILGSTGSTQLSVTATVTDDQGADVGAVSTGISSVTCSVDGIRQQPGLSPASCSTRRVAGTGHGLPGQAAYDRRDLH